MIDDLPPAARAEIQRILDAAARRLLAIQSSEATGNIDGPKRLGIAELERRQRRDG